MKYRSEYQKFRLGSHERLLAGTVFESSLAKDVTALGPKEGICTKARRHG